MTGHCRLYRAYSTTRTTIGQRCSFSESKRLFLNTSYMIRRKSLQTEIISLLFVVLFLYTGISKLLDFPIFKEQLNDSPILHLFANVVVWGLPVTEFVVSILLFLPSFRYVGLWASLVLLSAFTLYVLTVLFYDKTLPCSCGGIIGSLSWKAHLVVNILLTTLAGYSIYISKFNSRASKSSNQLTTN